MTDLRDKIAEIIHAATKQSLSDYDVADEVIRNDPEIAEADRATADAIIAALPDMVAPLVWDEWDGGLTSSCTPWGKYILGHDLCLSIPGNGSLRRYETEFAAKAAANAHHAAAVVAAFTGSK